MVTHKAGSPIPFLSCLKGRLKTRGTKVMQVPLALFKNTILLSKAVK